MKLLFDGDSTYSEEGVVGGGGTTELIPIISGGRGMRVGQLICFERDQEVRKVIKKWGTINQNDEERPIMIMIDPPLSEPPLENDIIMAGINWIIEE